MAGMNGVSAYQQINRTWQARNMGADRAGAPHQTKTDQVNSGWENNAPKIESSAFTPIETGSSLIPQKTEYGNTIGGVKLSDQAKDYYEKLKAKYHNLEFIAVSKDMKAQVQQNAASYGNANKMVVLIDEEKLERMATDESYRKKYEGIIAMSQSKLETAKNSLASSGANIKNFGMSVDSNGKESFFATVEKSQEQQKQRIEKKAAEKKEQKAKEKKRAEKKEFEERIEKSREKRAEKTGKDDKDTDEVEEPNEKEYVTFEANSMEALLTHVRAYSYEGAMNNVVTDAERMLGTQVDFKG